MNSIRKYLEYFKHGVTCFWKQCITPFTIITFLLFSVPALDSMILFRDLEKLEAICLLFMRCIFILTDVLFVSGIICVIYVLLKKWSKILSYIWIYLSLIATFTLAFGDIFMIRLFNRRFGAEDIELISLTTKSETEGFLSTYTFNNQVLYILLGLLSVVAFSGLIVYLIKRFNHYFHIFTAIIALIYIVGGLLYLKQIQTPQVDGLRTYPYYCDSYSNLYQGYRTYQSTLPFIEESAKAQLDIEIDSCTCTSSKIVLVIGESFNRHHSSLYGYNLDTNPELSQLENLYVYSDVISPINATIRAFQYFFSMASVDSDYKWYECPILPAIMKKAGYQVWFYSNQFPRENLLTSRYGGQFLSHHLTDSLSFDKRNDKVFQYDEDLVNLFTHDYIQENNRPEFIIFHLQGQHIPPKERCPDEYDYFTNDDIIRIDLTSTQKKQIADYDNATRYNDHVVKKIIDYFEHDDAIILYLADHGDEANDFRPHIGRSYDLGNGKDVLQNQLDIPFMIYTTSKYTERHPSIVEKIKYVQHYPFMLDDLPHVVLGLAGIKTKWYTAERDLLNDKYNTSRKRLVGGQYDYDQICKKVQCGL